MNRLKYKILAFIIATYLLSCKEGEKANNSKISLICVRSFDTLYISIINKSKDTIYTSSDLNGTFFVDGDTVFLEVVDKPKFNNVNYFRYSKIFPFDFFTTKRIEDHLPDTIINVIYPTYNYNQFRVRPFLAIFPNSSCIQSIIFNVPQRANIAQVVYYRSSFSNWLGKDSLTYELKDFIKFDSLNSNYVSSPIRNRFFVQ